MTRAKEANESCETDPKESKHGEELYQNAGGGDRSYPIDFKGGRNFGERQVAFDSSASITIANNGPLSVYVVGLVLKSEQESRSYELGFDIEPGKIYKHPFPPPSKAEGALPAGEEHFRVIMPLAKLADTWNEHFRKAVGLFQKCGMMLLYFSPSDPGFLQMKDAYSWKPERPLLNLLGLGYGDASGTLYYRVKGFTETKEQSVPLVVTVAVDGDKCPSWRPRAFYSNSKPPVKGPTYPVGLRPSFHRGWHTTGSRRRKFS